MTASNSDCCAAAIRDRRLPIVLRQACIRIIPEGTLMIGPTRVAIGPSYVVAKG